MSSVDDSHTIEGNSRKRRRITREDTPHVGSAVAIVPKMSDKIQAEDKKEEIAAPADGAVMPEATACLHEQSLKTLNSDLDTMRQLITCKICQRYLYEPYSLSCGHTFCYSCLSQWIGSNKKRTCPECRAGISTQPTPSYLIRELVSVFISRNELLPDGETIEEHDKLSKEEAQIVTDHKGNTDPKRGGLFSGVFQRAHRHSIRDESDNVDRCPVCLSEVEDGWCEACEQSIIDGDSDDFDIDEDVGTDASSPYGSELDHEMDALDADVATGLGPYGTDNVWGDYSGSDGDVSEANVFDRFDALHDRPMYRPFRASWMPGRRQRFIDDEEEDEDEDEDEDEEDDDDGFVVSDDRSIELESDAHTSDSAYTARLRSHEVESQGAEDVAAELPVRGSTRRRLQSRREPSDQARATATHRIVRRTVLSDTDDEASVTPSPRAQQVRSQRRARGRRIIDDEAEEEEVDDGMAYYGSRDPQILELESDLHYGDSDVTLSNEEREDHTDDEDDGDEDDDGSESSDTSSTTSWWEKALRHIQYSHQLTTITDHPVRTHRSILQRRTDRSSASGLARVYAAARSSPRMSGVTGFNSASHVHVRDSAPRHPFQLDDTLARINRHCQTTDRQQSQQGPRGHAHRIAHHPAARPRPGNAHINHRPGYSSRLIDPTIAAVAALENTPGGVDIVYRGAGSRSSHRGW